MNVYRVTIRGAFIPENPKPSYCYVIANTLQQAVKSATKRQATDLISVEMLPGDVYDEYGEDA